MPLRFDIISLFPDFFKGPFAVSMIKRGLEQGLVEIGLVDIRDFAEGRYKKVDDRPYGGGPGMVLMIKPVLEAIRSIKQKDSYVIYLSPQGIPLTAKQCARLSQNTHLIILCGHYEGIDERIVNYVDEEISIGDYVLTNGGPAAVVLIDAVCRFIPGFIGNDEGVQEDSFGRRIFDAPHYTRPPIFEGLAVPDVLFGGNHVDIERWRNEKAREKTIRVRPDLAEE